MMMIPAPSCPPSPRMPTSLRCRPSRRHALPPHPEKLHADCRRRGLQPSSFLRAVTDDHKNPSCPIKLAHGTTTLAFRFQGGIIVATDSRATSGNWIASQTVKKVIEIK